MMHGRAAALPLLLTLAFGVLAGPHPCRVEERATTGAAAVRAACHAAPAPETAPSGGGDDATPERLLCDKACNAPALMASAATQAGAGLVARLAAQPPRILPTPFLPSPDHIPLA